MLHIKGYILCLFHHRGEMWDYEVAEVVLDAFGLQGRYWDGTVHLTLIDLFSGGLLEEVGMAAGPSESSDRDELLFRFGLTDFGIERIRQAGLAKERVE